MMDATIKLKGGEVQQIIAEHLAAKGIKVKKVTLKVGTKCEDRPMGSSYPVFERAEVEIDLES